MKLILFSNCKLYANKVIDLIFIFWQLEKLICMYERDENSGKLRRQSC